MAAPASIPQQEYVKEIIRAARRLELEGDRIFAPHGLTVAQFNILNLLRQHQPMPQADLVKALVVGKATVSSLIGGLLKRKLVVQTADTKDRRANTLELSPDGTVLWHLASRACVRGLKKRLPRIREAEVEALRRALEPSQTEKALPLAARRR